MSSESIPRETLLKYFAATHSWPFPYEQIMEEQVSPDHEIEYIIDHRGTPFEGLIGIGHFLVDHTVSDIPQWIVTSVYYDRVYLKPFGENPLLPHLTEKGISSSWLTLRGIEEHYYEDKYRPGAGVEFANAVKNYFEGAPVNDIEDVKPLLSGMVGLRAILDKGKPRLSWESYNVVSAARYNSKLTPEDFVIDDAKRIVSYGFELTGAAEEGLVPPDEWNNFIRDPTNFTGDWEESPPFNTDFYENFALADWRFRNSEMPQERMEVFYTEWLVPRRYAVDLWDDFGGWTYDQIESPHTPEIIRQYFGLTDNMILWKIVRNLKRLWRWMTFLTDIEDQSDIQNAIDLLGHWQVDVQLRAAYRCMMYIASGPDEDRIIECRDALVDQFRKGGFANSRVNERVIKFFYHDDPYPEALAVAAEIDKTEARHDAYEGMAELGMPLGKYIMREEHPRAIYPLTSAMRVNIYSDDAPKYVPSEEEVRHLTERVIRILRGEFVFDDYWHGWATDSLANLISTMRSMDFPEEEITEARDALSDFERTKERRELEENPSGHGAGWMEYNRSEMERIIEEAEK